MTKILVCGGRIVDDTVWNKAVEFVKSYKPSCVISGKARGGDEIGECAARELGVSVLEFPADWDKFGKAAGHIRNQQMLDEGQPDLVIAFSGGAGTKSMVEKSLKVGVRVIKYD